MLERYVQTEGSSAKNFGHAIEEARTLAREYAICENWTLVFLQSTYDLLGRSVRGSMEEMMSDDSSRAKSAATLPERKPLSPAAQRALAEAEARRRAALANAKPLPKELQGPKGPEPTRYGDWEKRGIASDF